MHRQIRQKPRTLIPSSLLVRVLRSGPRFNCSGCDARMFVRYSSGLCPHCWNGHTPALHATVQAVSDGMALAGVLDDPFIE